MCLKTGAVCVAKAISLERRPSWRRLTSWSFGDARGDHFRYCQVGSKGLEGRRWSAAATLTEKNDEKKLQGIRVKEAGDCGTYCPCSKMMLMWFVWTTLWSNAKKRWQQNGLICESNWPCRRARWCSFQSRLWVSANLGSWNRGTI